MRRFFPIVIITASVSLPLPLSQTFAADVSANVPTTGTSRQSAGAQDSPAKFGTGSFGDPDNDGWSDTPSGQRWGDGPAFGDRDIAPRFSAPVSAAAVPRPAEIAARIRKGHSKLLLTDAVLKDLQRQVQSNPEMKRWFQALHREAENILKQPESRLGATGRLAPFGAAKTVQRRVYVLGLVYRVNGDKRFVERAWKELSAAADFPDWHPQAFLATAEMSQAFAIGYDWLYPAWTPQQRDKIRTALIEKGLKPALAAYQGKARDGWWVTSEYNWNPVCNSSIGFAALAIADEEPAMAGEILHHVLQSLPYATRHLQPDGGWNEGPSYWDYWIASYVMLIAGLQDATGTTFGLDRLKGFDRAGFFPVYMKGPLGLAFNFGDSGESSWGMPGMFWLARRFDQRAFGLHRLIFLKSPQGRPHPLDLLWASQWNDPALSNNAQPASAQDANAPGVNAQNTDAQNVNAQVMDGEITDGASATAAQPGNGQPAAPPGATPAKPARPSLVDTTLPLTGYFREVEAITFRTEWGTPRALFVGFKAGDTRPGHSHLDMGSFVLDMLAQRWAIDLGRASYESPERFGTYRFNYYRVRAEGHNTLVINPDAGPGQAETLCRITRYSSNPAHSYAIADLTAAYAGAGQVHRGIGIYGGEQVVVQDEIKMNRPSDVWWFMHTRADIQLMESAGAAILSQNGQRLAARILEPKGAQFRVFDALSFPSSPKINNQDDNTGIRKLTIALPKTRDTRLVVAFTPLLPATTELPPAPAIKPLADWK